MEEQVVEAKPEEVKPTRSMEPKVYTCVDCGKSSATAFFLVNPPNQPKNWEFDGEAMCLECYIRQIVRQTIRDIGLDALFFKAKEGKPAVKDESKSSASA
jgi:hypothetical protein